LQGGFSGCSRDNFGACFLDSGSSGDYHSRIAIGTTLGDSQARIGGLGNGVWIYSDNPTFVLPKNVTTEH